MYDIRVQWTIMVQHYPEYYQSSMVWIMLVVSSIIFQAFPNNFEFSRFVYRQLSILRLANPIFYSAYILILEKFQQVKGSSIYDGLTLNQKKDNVELFQHTPSLDKMKKFGNDRK